MMLIPTIRLMPSFLCSHHVATSLHSRGEILPAQYNKITTPSFIQNSLEKVREITLRRFNITSLSSIDFCTYSTEIDVICIS